MATQTFTLDKDTTLSPVIALADTPMQISVTQDSDWTYGTTRLRVHEETATEGVYEAVAGYEVGEKSKPNPFNLKPKNYKLELAAYTDSDSVTIIVS